jgi:AraC-like DNA-binding protein
MLPKCFTAEATVPEEFITVHRPEDARLTVTGTGRFLTKYSRVDLRHIWSQAATEALPRVLESQMSGLRHGLSLLLEPGPNLICSGAEVEVDGIGLHPGSRKEAYQRLTGPGTWATMSLTVEDWCEYGVALQGVEPRFLPHGLAIQPPLKPMRQLRRLLRTIHGMADRQDPVAFEHPQAVHSMETAIIRAACACFAGQGISKTRSAIVNHASIMRRFANLVEANAETPLYLPDVCVKLAVSVRTLRQCCQDYYGIGPKRYLLLRRLHLAHRALLVANDASAQVTAIATQYGFWELGRFSVAYRHMFGESPRTTLQRRVDPDGTLLPRLYGAPTWLSKTQAPRHHALHPQ